MIITAEFTNIELRKARESRKMPRWKLANECGVSEDTIERWERGETTPHPDDIGRIEKALDIDGLWHKWMYSNIESYRERHSYMPYKDNLTETIVRMKHELSDITPILNCVERDALDGSIDDAELRKKFRKEVKEAMAAMQQALDRTKDNT